MSYSNIPYSLDVSSLSDLQQWYNHQSDEILLSHGAVVVRGLKVLSNNDFHEVVSSITEPKTFRDANSIRAKYTSGVYNASEYDQDQPIRLHTEYSYSSLWPARLYFCCIQKAAIGGESSIGDARNIYHKLGTELVSKFEQLGIRYIRNIYGKEQGGMSWQDAFETTSKDQLEHYCKTNSIDYQWITNEHLRLIQVRPAVRKHPTTNEQLWFNQVDQFFPEVYGEEFLYAMELMYGKDKANFPMYATYGNGEPISYDVVMRIIQVLDEETSVVRLENGNIIILDNMMKLHGRLPFSGDRRMVVAMS